MAALCSFTREERQRGAAVIRGNRQVAIAKGQRGAKVGDANSQLSTCNGFSTPAESISCEYGIKQDSYSSLIDFKSSAAANIRSIRLPKADIGVLPTSKVRQFVFLQPLFFFLIPSFFLKNCAISNHNKHVFYLLNINNILLRPFVDPP